MKARVLLSLLFFLSTSVLAKNLDGTLWAVKKKSCEGKDVAISAEEKVQFGNEMFAYISRSSETSKDYCDEALAYQRNIRSTSELEDRYTEVSFLSQYSVRTVCRNKQIDAVISDQTHLVKSDWQLLTIAMKADSGELDWTQSAKCPHGKLHLEIEKM